MRKNFGAKSILYPMPVFIVATFNDDGTPNAMNAAWGGIHDINQVAVCIAPEHKTAKNILKQKCFTISMADAMHVAECDYLGIVSGDEVPDKLAKAGFHTVKSEFVDAPVIEELPMCIECKLISFDDKTGCTVGEIVNINANDAILTDGKIDPEKLQPITFDSVNNTYLKIGEKAGNAFKDGLKFK